MMLLVAANRDYTAYFDASGDKSQKVLSVAGFVAPNNNWITFQDEWCAILATVPADQFRMTKFVSSVKPFQDFKGKPGRRITFFNQLLKCIRRNTFKGFACGTLMPDYRKVDLVYKLSETLPPYATSAGGCLGGLKSWATARAIDWKSICVVFEDGDGDQGNAIETVRKEGWRAIRHSKRDIRAFDACDLAAWKTRVVLDDVYHRELYRNDRESADRIMKSLVEIETVIQSNRMMRRNPLLNICFQENIEKRTRYEQP